MIAELAVRLLWFVVAASVGLLWAFGEAAMGRSLTIQGHAVLGTLFVVALASGGYDLRQFLQWRREVLGLAQDLSLRPREVEDAKRLLRAIKERNPAAMRAIREALRDEDT